MWRLSVGFILIINSCGSIVDGRPRPSPKVPCHFIFGDSLFDPGNNNDLNTLAKANYPPYGIDFPGGVATGRFTNGLTVSDVLTKLLGFKEFIPPFRNETGDMILKGVNYASGSAGLLPQSGSHLGDRIWLSRQVSYHETTIAELRKFVKGRVDNYLNKCLYSINTGSNDYINNYFMPNLYPSSRIFSPDQFATQLLLEFKLQLQRLYNLGARKTAIFGLGLIGCIPAELQKYNKKFGCVEEINEAVKLFNKKLVNVIDSYNSNLPDANFTFVNVMAMQSSANIIPGFRKTTSCCKQRESDNQCVPSSTPCSVRAIKSFFDGFHPTQMLNVLTASNAFISPFNIFVHPVDINTLVSNNN